ncbi:MAG: MBL fold metallo-hydrolase [Candidatus Staskawiczbacteria bacterium]|nr:MBL fold metallo-hydrolase [Candidatus Staskawiczbacteria bacterium]
MKINFLGAAQNVTGSKHLINVQGYNLLLDCGMYQGKREESNRQNSTLPFLATDINAVILSHAHLDHCGTLPILVKQGFAGKIYCTPATAEIARYILLDAAEIQKQDCLYFNSHLQEGENEIFPIYTADDVQKVIECFEPIEYFRNTNQWTTLNENIRFKLYDAGHILGSSIIFLEITEGATIKTLAFTGDLGRERSPILCSPEYVTENVQTLIAECTYGDRNHRPLSDATSDFKNVINAVIKTKGKIILPAFSLGRTQEIIYTLHKLLDEKLIPSLPIYVDSPLAENITEIFPKFIKDFDKDFWKDFGNRGESPFSLKNLTYTKSSEESKALNNMKGPLIIISASGMCEGGRVLHHLKNAIENPQNIILLVGYQAENTLGRKLQDGISPVKIYGKSYNVKAQIKTLNEFSAHADQNDLLLYISNVKNLQKIFLVHTEPSQSTAFKAILEKTYPSLPIEIPNMGDSFEV